MNLHKTDALVAEAMGWKLILDKHYHGCGGAVFAVLPSGERLFMWHLEENVYSGESRWSPTTDWSAAGQVVEWMKKQETFAQFKLFVVCVEWDDTDVQTWQAQFCMFEEPDGAAYREYMHRTITAPLAICLAFLRAMGVEVGE